MSSMYDQYKRYLSKKEERELFYAMKDGDELARDELIMAHAYLIIKIAKRYSRYGPQEDLEQEGFVALVNCVDAYDVEKGRLRMYAHQAIKTYMVRFLAKNSDLIKLPDPQVHQLIILLKIKDELMVELQREPNYDDLMSNQKVLDAYKKYCQTKDTKFTLKEYVKLIEFSEPVSSLNYPVADDSDIILEDIVEDPKSESEQERFEKKDFIMAIMEELDDQKKYILMNIARGMTMQELADELGITTQAISYHKCHAIKKIKEYIETNPELKEIVGDLKL